MTLKSVKPDEWPERLYGGKAVVRFPNGVESGSWYSTPDARGEHTLEYVRADLVDPAAIREAWEKAYWRMRSYAVHDNDCKLNKPPRFDGPCSCGLTAALEEALALIPKGADK